MAEVKIRTHGNPTFSGVEFENFSTEETLLAVLKQLQEISDAFGSTGHRSQKKDEDDKKHQSRLEKLFSDTFGESRLNPTASHVAKTVNESQYGDVIEKILGAFEGDIESFLGLTLVINVLESSIKLFNKSLDFAAQALASVFHAAGAISAAFLDGKTAMADYAKVIQGSVEHIPIIGRILSILTGGIITLDRWNQTLLQLSTIGLNFGGSLSDMIIAAAQTGLTLDEFSKVIQSNADSLAAFGGMIQGVSVFTHVTSLALANYTTQLNNMGVSFQQFSDEAPAILGLFGATMLARGASERQLTEATVDLIGNFNAMSEISGKSRKQQEDELAKQTANSAFQQQMAALRPAAQSGIAMIMNTLNQVVGTSTGDLFKDFFIHQMPQTQRLQTLLFMDRNIYSQFQQISAINNSSLTSVQKQQAIAKVAVQIQADIVNSAARYHVAIGAGTAGLSGIVQDILGLANESTLTAKNALNANGTLNTKLRLSNVETSILNNQHSKGISESLQQFNFLMSSFELSFKEGVIGPLINAFGPLLSSITTNLAKNKDVINIIINNLIGIVQQVSNWLGANKGRLSSMVGSFEHNVIEIIKIIVFVTKAIAETGEFISKHWEAIKWTTLAIGATLALMAGVISVKVIGPILKAIFEIIRTLPLLADALKMFLMRISGMGGFGGPSGRGGTGNTPTTITGKGVKIGEEAGESAETGEVIEGVGTTAAEGAEVAGGAEVGEMLSVGGMSLGIPVVGEVVAGLTAVGLAGWGIYKLISDHDKKEKEDKEKEKNEKTHSTPSVKSVQDHLNQMHSELKSHNNTLVTTNDYLKEVHAELVKLNRTSTTIKNSQ